MTQAPSAEQQFLMGGGGAPSAFTKHDGAGTTRGGKIVEKPELRQQTDFETGELLTWSDGNPRMHLVVTVATDQRDPQRDDDDGQRRLYVKSALQRAVRDAIKTAGAAGLEVGGTLMVTRTGRDTPTNPKMDGAWLYSAVYTPAADNFLAGGGAAETGERQPEPAPQAGGADEFEAALSKLPAEQAAAMRAANINLEGLKAMGLA